MQIISWNSFLDTFFDETTMSVHFVAENPFLAKRGAPWNLKSTYAEVIQTRADLENIVRNIQSEIDLREDSFLEIDEKYSKVLQLWPYRIVIVYPPLANKMEITIVKPVKRLSLEDYNLDQATQDMLINNSKWIIIAGSPWSGKTTFWQALVEKLADHNIVKTLESPRDLIVPSTVTQYSFSYGSHNELRNILLLSRPDFTMYDEIRNTDDFLLYKDLRLTGIGMIWVLHATKGIDSIQRFLWKIDMWMIPQVVDTIVFIEKGWIGEILTLELVVKVPAGMQSGDLSRPVIEVSSYFDQKAAYEMYSYGEQIVVIPLDKIQAKDEKKSPVAQYAKEHIMHILGEYIPFDYHCDLKWDHLYVYIDEKNKWKVIGSGGEKINALEKKIWLSISLRSRDDAPVLDIDLQINNQKHKVELVLPVAYAQKTITMILDGHVYRVSLDAKAKAMIKNKKLQHIFTQHTPRILEVA